MFKLSKGFILMIFPFLVFSSQILGQSLSDVFVLDKEYLTLVKKKLKTAMNRF